MRAFSLAVALVASSASAGEFRLAVLDVGQGDATVLVTPSGCAALFDGGPTGAGTTIKAYLKSIGVTKLDLLVVSHFHADHMGGADEIDSGTDAVAVAKVYDRGGTYSSAAFESYAATYAGRRVTAVRGETMNLCGEVSIRFVAAGGYGLSTTNENGLSVVAKVSYGAFDALIGGDATSGDPNLEATFAADVGEVEFSFFVDDASLTYVR